MDSDISTQPVPAEKAVPVTTESNQDNVEVRFKISQKSLLIIGAFVLALAVVGVAGAYILNNKSSDTTQNNNIPGQLAGELALAEGDVQYLSTAANAEWVAAIAGQSIAQGQAIKTGVNSRAVINLDDGSAVRLDQSSEIRLVALSSTSIAITQVSGRAYHRVEPGQLTYKVTTTQATATALGTIFSTEQATDTSNVVVLESKVKVEPKSKLDSTEVASGKTALINKDGVRVDDIDDSVLGESFYTWNKALDKGEPIPSITATPTPTPEPTAVESTPAPTEQAPSASLSLSGTVGAGKVSLSWQASGLDTSKGFKVLKSHDGTPTFGKDSAVYVSDSNARSYTWDGLHDKVTYFRVGVYNGSGITWYSNTITLTPQPKAAKPPYTGAITLSSPTTEGSKVKLSWVGTRKEQVEGWKVVYSTSTNPTYGKDSAQFASASDTSATIGGLESGKTYYFRVGAYIDGKVASNAYSNQVVKVAP